MKALDNGCSSNGRYSGNPGLQQVGHKGSQVREGEEDIHLEKVESEITIWNIKKISVVMTPIKLLEAYDAGVEGRGGHSGEGRGGHSPIRISTRQYKRLL